MPVVPEAFALSTSLFFFTPFFFEHTPFLHQQKRYSEKKKVEMSFHLGPLTFCRVFLPISPPFDLLLLLCLRTEGTFFLHLFFIPLFFLMLLCTARLSISLPLFSSISPLFCSLSLQSHCSLPHMKYPTFMQPCVVLPSRSVVFFLHFQNKISPPPPPQPFFPRPIQLKPAHNLPSLLHSRE